MMPERSVVMAGGAIGPDAWAAEHARSRHHDTVEYKLDGYRWLNGVKKEPWINTASALIEYPLQRNVSMVAAAERAAKAGWNVGVLALYAPWSTTHGTAYTAKHAKAAGFEVSERIYEATARSESSDVVWIDTETGGFSHENDPLIEIGAVWSDPTSRKIISTFEAKLAVPRGMSVHPRAAMVNGYTPELWRDAKPAKEVLAEFAEWLPNKFFAGAYNAPFDKRFLQHNFMLHTASVPGWHPKWHDPRPVVEAVLKKTGRVKSASLKDACEHFGIRNDVRHRALADAERARLVFLGLLDKADAGSFFDRSAP